MTDEARPTHSLENVRPSVCGHSWEDVRLVDVRTTGDVGPVIQKGYLWLQRCKHCGLLSGGQMLVTQ